MNSGFKQATVLYKVTPDGLPVDTQGRLTEVSGGKQAIALLNGATNPDPNKYEVEIYFNKGASVWGTPSTTYDPTTCPVSIFSVNKNSIVLHPANASEVITVYSTFGWQLKTPLPFVNFVPPSAGKNTTTTTAQPGASYGQGYATFKELATGKEIQIYVVNTDALGWILATGTWNNLRFWEAGGVWNY